jgi:hypothetical protein
MLSAGFMSCILMVGKYPSKVKRKFIMLRAVVAPFFLEGKIKL